MPPFRTVLLLFSVSLVGMEDGGGVDWDGGVGLGRLPVWLTSPGVGQIERGVEVWGDAPGWSPLNPGLWTNLSPTGGPARLGSRMQSATSTTAILHSTFHFFNFLSPYIDFATHTHHTPLPSTNTHIRTHTHTHTHKHTPRTRTRTHRHIHTHTHTPLPSHGHRALF